MIMICYECMLDNHVDDIRVRQENDSLRAGISYTTENPQQTGQTSQGPTALECTNYTGSSKRGHDVSESSQCQIQSLQTNYKTAVDDTPSGHSAAVDTMHGMVHGTAGSAPQAVPGNSSPSLQKDTATAQIGILQQSRAIHNATVQPEQPHNQAAPASGQDSLNEKDEHTATGLEDTEMQDVHIGMAVDMSRGEQLIAALLHLPNVANSSDSLPACPLKENHNRGGSGTEYATGTDARNDEMRMQGMAAKDDLQPKLEELECKIGAVANLVSSISSGFDPCDPAAGLMSQLKVCPHSCLALQKHIEV